MLRRAYHAVDLATGRVHRAVAHALTSLPPQAATAALLEALWHGYWTIENRVYYVRDVTLGEDAGQQRTGNAPQARAALHNGVLTCVAAGGATSLTPCGTTRALCLLGALPDRL